MKGNDMIHELKIDNNYLDAKLAGDKLFEIRFNDRGYQKGDFVKYKRWNQDECKFEYFLYEITYVISYMQKDNWVVFGEKLVKDEGGE